MSSIAVAPTARTLAFANGAFRDRHRARLGPPIDLGDLSPSVVPPDLLPNLRSAWQERVRSEFRSIQIMTRFLTEVTGAGDPLDVYTAAVELVEDEIRHAELCAAVCERLQAPALLPATVALPDAASFLESPMPERALSTAISMLAVNETISSAIIADLLHRCDYEPIRRVLQATIQDESVHGAFGWDYIRASIARFDQASRGHWRRLTAIALEPHRAFADRVLGPIPAARRTLDAFPESELARFGLLSAERQALIFENVFAKVLAPKLREYDLIVKEG